MDDTKKIERITIQGRSINVRLSDKIEVDLIINFHSPYTSDTIFMYRVFHDVYRNVDNLINNLSVVSVQELVDSLTHAVKIHFAKIAPENRDISARIIVWDMSLKADVLKRVDVNGKEIEQ